MICEFVNSQLKRIRNKETLTTRELESLLISVYRLLDSSEEIMIPLVVSKFALFQKLSDSFIE